MILCLFLFYLFCNVSLVSSLDNGLALTPPMGWLHWERFRCVLDCELYPDDCISEKLFKTMADRMAQDGFLEAGYEYLIADDCWLARERDQNGKLQADPDRFPSGIKSLADYAHGKGLKFGIYEDYGTKTCAGYPGSLEHLELDANTFAEWGIDYLKFDGCNVAHDKAMEQGHLEMASYLNKTGRPIVFSCEFPFYLGPATNYTIAIEACNRWRVFYDIQDSWNSLTKIVQYYEDNQGEFTSIAGPGHWNDPDMLIIGNFGLSYDQSIAQMTLWTIWAAPLIMSNDLRKIRSEFRDILLNKDAVAINQDPLGIQGHLLMKLANIDVWIKRILPKVGNEFSYALGFVSYREDGFPHRLEFTLASFKLTNPAGYLLTDVFQQSNEDLVNSDKVLAVQVNPTGAVLWRLTVVEEFDNSVSKYPPE